MYNPEMENSSGLYFLHTLWFGIITGYLSTFWDSLKMERLFCVNLYDLFFHLWRLFRNGKSKHLKGKSEGTFPWLTNKNFCVSGGVEIEEVMKDVRTHSGLVRACILRPFLAPLELFVGTIFVVQPKAPKYSRPDVHSGPVAWRATQSLDIKTLWFIISMTYLSTYWDSLIIDNHKDSLVYNYHDLFFHLLRLVKSCERLGKLEWWEQVCTIPHKEKINKYKQTNKQTSKQVRVVRVSLHDSS